MNIQDNYLKNKKNIFFSDNKVVQNHRKKLINIFENDSFDKKNNESLKNINFYKATSSKASLHDIFRLRFAAIA